jgi:fumarate hydratase class I
MTTIPQDDLIESIRAALQYISFYHPVDYITNLANAYELEQSPAAKDARSSSTRACARRAIGPSARTPASSPSS